MKDIETDGEVFTNNCSSDTFACSQLYELGPSHAKRPSIHFRAVIQDSAALPSVWGLCCSAAHSYLCHQASETCIAWNTAGPIFDA